MSSIDAELLIECKAIILEVLVPFEVQQRLPRIRNHWREIVETEEGESACRNFFLKTVKNRRSVCENLVAAVGSRDRDIMYLRDALYERLGKDHYLIDSFIARPVTDGNEQCPYWDNLSYAEPPAARPPKNL